MIVRNCDRVNVGAPILWALIFATGFIFASFEAQPLFAQVQYTIDGKRVSASAYEAAKLVNASVRDVKENRINEAIKQLRRALQYNPQLAEAHAMLGLALARQGKTAEATEQMQMAVNDNPQLLVARLNLAGLQQTTGKLQDAVTSYKKIVAECPDAKQIGAIDERIELLSRELAREKAAVNSPAAEKDRNSYYEDIVAQGKRQWPQSAMPLRVYLYAGDTISSFRPEYDGALRDAFEEWQKVSDGKVRFQFVDSPNQADIDCHWVEDAKELQSAAEGGEAQEKSIGGAIVNSHILLSVSDAGSAFPLTTNLVHTVALHEIGHSLGLLGHSAHPGDILFCTAPIIDREQHLSKRDINTLRQLYENDVDKTSQLVFDLDRATNGKALITIRVTVLILGIILSFAAIGIYMVRKLGKKTKKKRGARKR